MNNNENINDDEDTHKHEQNKIVTVIDNDSPLQKIPLLQRCFLFASDPKRLSSPIRLASVSSSWNEALRVYGAGALVWRNAFKAKPKKVTSFLHAACCRGGFPWIVDHLLAAGVDPDSTDNGGYTALHHIAKNSSLSAHALECIPILIKHNADLNPKNKKGMTPLEVACELGQVQAVVALLSAGAAPPEDFLQRCAESGSAVLTRLAFKKMDCNVDQQDSQGRTPLMRACTATPRGSSIGVLLTEFHADAAITDSLNRTALELWAEALYGDITAGRSTLSKDYCNGRAELADFLRHQSNPTALINHRGSFGRTILHQVFQQHTSAVPALTLALKHGADPNITDAAGNTPLHDLILHSSSSDIFTSTSIIRGNIPVLQNAIELLVKHGAKISIKTPGGDTALDIFKRKWGNAIEQTPAYQRGYEQAVAMLETALVTEQTT